MNSAVIMGRLTRDPELRYFNNNQAVVKFTLAVDKNLSREKKQEAESQNKPTADFINCQAWDKIGENIAKFTAKGKRILVTGRIQTGSYEDKDGKRVYTTDIVVNNVEFIDWKDSNSSQGNFDNSSNFQSGNNSTNGKNGTVEEFDFGADFKAEDERLPF